MADNNTENPPSKFKFSTIRDAAIVLACVAVAYTSLHKPSLQVAEATQSTSPASSSSPAASKAPAGNQIHVSGGRLTLGDDELSDRFRAFLKARVDEINRAGPVSLGLAGKPEEKPESSASPQSTSTSRQISQPPQHQQAIEPRAKSEGTFHPAPFSDSAAQASIDAITKTVIANKGTGVVQIGRHLDGSMMTKAETEQQIRGTLAAIPDEWTITYKSPNEKVRLYVFTDTTCPFCHKLHASMSQLLDAGISVHYLLYPRDMGNTPAGSLSRTAVNMKNIWCSVDQQQAMDTAFEGYKVADADCASLPESLHRRPAPVPDHYQAGSMFNVEATPTWLASNGKHGVGFTNAQVMIQTLLGN